MRLFLWQWQYSGTKLLAQNIYFNLDLFCAFHVIIEIPLIKIILHGILVHENSAQYEIVVLVNKNITGFSNLKNKTYCYPGHALDIQLVTRYILTQFERMVFKENRLIETICNYKVESNTYLERYFKGLAEFFGTSRRRIQCSDDALETQLSKYYKKLFVLTFLAFVLFVANKYNNLMQSDEYSDFKTVLNCLLESDVALTTLRDFQIFFDESENKNKKQNYKFLCPNGMVQELNAPCSWIRQPWKLFVVNKK